MGKKWKKKRERKQEREREGEREIEIEKTEKGIICWIWLTDDISLLEIVELHLEETTDNGVFQQVPAPQHILEKKSNDRCGPYYGRVTKYKYW